MEAIQLLLFTRSVMSLCDPMDAACQTSLSFIISRSFLKLVSTELVMPSNHLILCRPLLLLPSIFSSIKVFSNESALRIRWPKHWSYSFSISLSNDYSGLIFFRMDWLDLLAVQGTLKSLLQHHNLKASILRGSTFSMVQLGCLLHLQLRAPCLGRKLPLALGQRKPQKELQLWMEGPPPSTCSG